MFILIYKYYLNPTFEYAHYNLLDRSGLSLLLAGVIAIIPVFFYKEMKEISSFIAILIYALCYVPAIIMLLLSLDKDVSEVLEIQIALMFGMVLFFLMDRIILRNVDWKIGRQLSIQFLHIATFIFTTVVIYTYAGHMRLVGFADVYDLRLENNEIQMNVAVGYVVMWLTYCLYPLYLVLGITNRNRIYFLCACLGNVIIYMSTGAKASLLSPFIILCMYVLLKIKGDFLPNLLLILSGVSLFLLFVAPADNVVFLWARSILFARTMGTEGWSIYTYYEFFTANKLTYFSHISFINAITHSYPYGSLSLGQVIGVEYSGSEVANFNANFWASDGIASLGIPGIYFMNFVIAFFLVFINHITRKFDTKFICLCFTSFVLAMLNIPFLTALVSGGGLLTIVIILGIDIKAPLKSGI